MTSKNNHKKKIPKKKSSFLSLSLGDKDFFFNIISFVGCWYNTKQPQNRKGHRTHLFNQEIFLTVKKNEIKIS